MIQTDANTPTPDRQEESPYGTSILPTSFATPPGGREVQYETSQYIMTIGDIGITPEVVVTPNGSAPLRGSSWIFTDMSRTESKIPSVAIVLAIIFALACLIGLLFLLMKETTTVGYVDVSVRSGTLYHKTQIPVSTRMQIARWHQLVSHAQSLAAQAV